MVSTIQQFVVHCALQCTKYASDKVIYRITETAIIRQERSLWQVRKLLILGGYGNLGKICGMTGDTESARIGYE